MTYKIFYRFLSLNFHTKRASSPNYEGRLFLPPAEMGFSSSNGFILGVVYGFDFFTRSLLSFFFCVFNSVFFIRLWRLRRFSAQKGKFQSK
jgi:hypothetical protein